MSRITLMLMEVYKNKKGTSGVVSYKIEADAVAVQFAGNAVYRYTYLSTGKKAVEHMKKLAYAGEGLSTYISRYVKDKYE